MNAKKHTFVLIMDFISLRFRAMNAMTPTAVVETSSLLPLSDLRPGERGTIVSVAPDLAAGRRLLALGFVPGSEVAVRREAPLKCPVEYSVRGASVSLRRQEASWIFVRTAVR